MLVQHGTTAGRGVREPFCSRCRRTLQALQGETDMAQRKGYLNGFGFQMAMVFSFIFLLTTAAWAQLPTGTILGVVKDTTGGTVAGAVVTATNVDNGATRAGMTGEDGAYRFPALPVGNWSVRVMKDGFETADRKGITLDVTQEAEINFT